MYYSTLILKKAFLLQQNTNIIGNEQAGLVSLTLIFILIVMILSGVGGGYAGYLLGPPDPGELDKQKRKWYLQRSLVLGIVASFMVPLFLSVVGVASGSETNLIDQLTSQSASIGTWLILVGFCLIAGVSSQRFISALTNKILDEVLAESRSATERANVALEGVEELEDDLEQVQFTSPTQQPPELSDNLKAVLQAVDSSHERRPTLNDIKLNNALTDFEVRDVNTALVELEDKGFVKSKEIGGTERWRIRSVGKAILRKFNDDSKSNVNPND